MRSRATAARELLPDHEQGHARFATTSDPHAKLEDLRKTVNTDYFDIMLLHWQHTATWPQDTARWQDAILAAEEKKTIVGHGASVHGLPALRQMPGNQWLQVAMIRMNHNGTRMDAEIRRRPRASDGVSEVVQHVQQVRKEGMGVISMKLIRRRRVREPRRPAEGNALCVRSRRAWTR